MANVNVNFNVLPASANFLSGTGYNNATMGLPFSHHLQAFTTPYGNPVHQMRGVHHQVRRPMHQQTIGPPRVFQEYAYYPMASVINDVQEHVGCPCGFVHNRVVTTPVYGNYQGQVAGHVAIQRHPPPQRMPVRAPAPAMPIPPQQIMPAHMSPYHRQTVGQHSMVATNTFAAGVPVINMGVEAAFHARNGRQTQQPERPQKRRRVQEKKNMDEVLFVKSIPRRVEEVRYDEIAFVSSRTVTPEVQGGSPAQNTPTTDATSSAAVAQPQQPPAKKRKGLPDWAKTEKDPHKAYLLGQMSKKENMEEHCAKRVPPRSNKRRKASKTPESIDLEKLEEQQRLMTEDGRARVRAELEREQAAKDKVERSRRMAAEEGAARQRGIEEEKAAAKARREAAENEVMEKQAAELADVLGGEDDDEVEEEGVEESSASEAVEAASSEKSMPEEPADVVELQQNPPTPVDDAHFASWEFPDDGALF